MQKNVLVIAALGLFFGLMGAPLTGVAEESEQMPLPSAEEQKLSGPSHMFPLVSAAASAITKARDAYLEERGMTLGVTAKGSYIGWGEAKIGGHTEDIDWGQRRIAAYERAYQDALGEFVRSKRRVGATVTVRKFGDADYQPADGATVVSELALIKDKVLALAEAKLDETLRNSGVNPDEISGKSLKQKQVLMQDTITRKINTDSFAAVSGTRILIQFEDLTDIGLVIVNSMEYRGIAKRIAEGKVVGTVGGHDPVADIRRQIREAAPNNEQFIPMTGVRVMTDKNGDRVLVSFGQWSPAVTITESQLKIDSKIKAAKLIAYDHADGAITDFIKTTTALDQDTALGAADSIAELTFRDRKEEDERSDIGAIIAQFVKTNGRSDLTGVSRIGDWAVNHPETGHLLVGTILMWSPTLSLLAESEPSEEVAPVEPGSGKGKKQSEVKTGADLDKDATF